jgi:TldD protein
MGQYPVATGSWSTPIRIDPFQIPIEEKVDFVVSLVGLYPKRTDFTIGGGMNFMAFSRAEGAVATTDGAYFTQTLYQSGGHFSVAARRRKKNVDQRGAASATGLTMSGAGWELFLDAKVPEQIPQLIDTAEALAVVPSKPVEIGRYDLVCSALMIGTLIASTLGPATELDRSLGFEANSGGTSYLGPDPYARLGTTLGSPLLHVQADRSMDKGLATVKWDDEGVVPDTFTLVDKGTLVDYQTNREQAAWLKEWYVKRGQPVRSHGCAAGGSALETTLQMTPNLSLTPGADNVSFDDLVANTKRGIAWIVGGARMDFQFREGVGNGVMREIVNGKLGAFIVGGQMLFSSSELWKSLVALGGASSREQIPSKEDKGEPQQAAAYSVSAVPGVLKEMPIVDARRKA